MAGATSASGAAGPAEPTGISRLVGVARVRSRSERVLGVAMYLGCHNARRRERLAARALNVASLAALVAEVYRAHGYRRLHRGALGIDPLLHCVQHCQHFVSSRRGKTLLEALDVVRVGGRAAFQSAGDARGKRSRLGVDVLRPVGGENARGPHAAYVALPETRFRVAFGADCGGVLLEVGRAGIDRIRVVVVLLDLGFGRASASLGKNLLLALLV